MSMNLKQQLMKQNGVDANQLKSGIRTILKRRWPEAEPLFDKMLSKAATDQSYAQELRAYFDGEGSTLMLRDLLCSFGSYMGNSSEDREFRNAVNAIDSASHMVVTNTMND